MTASTAGWLLTVFAATVVMLIVAALIWITVWNTGVLIGRGVAAVRRRRARRRWTREALAIASAQIHAEVHDYLAETRAGWPADDVAWQRLWREVADYPAQRPDGAP